MEVVVGIACDDHVIVAANAAAAIFNVLKIKSEEDKLEEFDDSRILVATGDIGERTQFTDYVLRNLHLKKMIADRPETPSACAHYIRGILAEAIRSRSPYIVNNVVLAAFQAPKEGKPSPDDGGSLYYLDYLGSLTKAPFFAVGFGGSFSVAILDKEYHHAQSVDASIAQVKACLKEVQMRSLIDNSNWICKVVTKDGLSRVDLNA